MVPLAVDQDGVAFVGAGHVTLQRAERGADGPVLVTEQRKTQIVLVSKPPQLGNCIDRSADHLDAERLEIRQ